MSQPYKFNPKPEFDKRMNEILELSGSNEEDKQNFWKMVRTPPQKSIRCNTLKISPEELKEKLEQERGWKIEQPFEEHPEMMIIKNPLLPGELGRSREHLLGYYYIQEISSMMPVIALDLNENDFFLDLCAAPGSKTTQAAAMMKNKGKAIANDKSFGRMAVLVINLERCGVSNAIVTRKDGCVLCEMLAKSNFHPNKILLDASCTKEGTIRSDPAVLKSWNPKMMGVFAKEQKKLASSVLEILRSSGEIIYSTCTHAPEENEEVMQFLLDNFDIEIEKISLPVKIREGLTGWHGKKFDEQIKNCARIYPQDNNTGGFFICKIKKLSDKDKNQEERG